MTVTGVSAKVQRSGGIELAEEPAFISVIAPVRNEAASIGATLRQVLDQEYPADAFEVLVADGRSTDASCDIVRSLQSRYFNLRLLDNPGQLSSAGRNRAIQSAQGDLVVVIDGHCELPDRLYLKKLAAAFRRSNADCIGRPQPLDISRATPLQRAIARGRACWLGHHPDSSIYSSGEGFVAPQSVAVAYRREVFDRVGLFDEAFDACEDVEFNHRVDRAGLRCFFTPAVAVRYQPRANLAGLFRQMMRYGRGRVRLWRKHPETFTWTGFVPAFFLLGLLAGPLLGLISPWLALTYAATLGLYAFLVAIASLSIACQERSPRVLAWLPLVFPTIHLGAGAGQVLEWLFPATSRGTRADTARAPLRVAVRQSPEPDQRILNALTIDVEDYFHVANLEKCVRRYDWGGLESRIVESTQQILDLLEQTETRGTFYILGWVAERHPELVRAIRSGGHEIGCHGYWHRIVYQQSPEQFRDDLRLARQVLQDILGEPVVSYRAPCFSITQRNLWAFDVLIDEGFQYDSSVYPTFHHRYGLAGSPLGPHRVVRPGGSLLELPLSVYRCCGYPLPVGGGGYLRLYPYRFTRHGLRAVNERGRPAVVYLHPWELDADQPRLKPGPLSSFRHYVNLHRTRSRLRKLLRDFPLGTVSEVVASVEEQGKLWTWDMKQDAEIDRPAA